LTHKDQEKDKDLNLVLKESLRTRTRTKINITGDIMVEVRAELGKVSPLLWFRPLHYAVSNAEPTTTLTTVCNVILQYRCQLVLLGC